MPPKLKMKNFEDMEIIRPLYLIRRIYNEVDEVNRTYAFKLCDMVAAKKIGNKEYPNRLIIKKLGKKTLKMSIVQFLEQQKCKYKFTIRLWVNGHKVEFQQKIRKRQSHFMSKDIYIIMEKYEK